jgi:hypothetical protein
VNPFHSNPLKGMNSFRSKPLKVVIEREVHVAPLGIQGWDEALGVCPRGQGWLFSELCPKL